MLFVTTLFLFLFFISVQLKVLKPTHVLRIAADHALESFVESDADTRLILFISWGMLERDLSGCHFSTPDCRGEQVWDTSFNPSTPEAQLAMKVMSFPVYRNLLS